MDTQIKSFAKRLDPHFLKLGTKINILVFALLLISMVIISRVGMHQFKKYIHNETLKNLEQLSDIKKFNAESGFNGFLARVPSILSDDLLYSIGDMIAAFDEYEYNRSEAFNPDSLEYYGEMLDTFYVNEIIGNIKWDAPSFYQIKAENPVQIVLQYSYIVQNPFSDEQKRNFTGRVDNTEYSFLHSNLQKKFKIILEKNKINNVYIIDSRKGNIIYNYNKNIALAANIYDSYLKNSHLALAYQKALASNRGVVVSDIENFIPELNKPVSFASTPVFVDGEKVAVAVFELTPAFYESILYSDVKDINENQASYVLVGDDNILRTSDIQQLQDSSGYFNKLHKSAKSNRNFDKAYRTNSGALALAFDKSLNVDYIATEAKNYNNQDVFLVKQKLDFPGLNYSLVVQKAKKESMEFFRKVQIISAGVFLLLAIIAFILTRFFRESILRRLNLLKKNMRELVKGEHSEDIDNRWHDELGSTINVYKDLSTRIDAAGNFALQLSEGNFDIHFDAQSENDRFAKSLNTLKQKLQIDKADADKRAQEDTIRNWNNEGIAKFNDLLRQSNNNIQDLSYLIIQSLVEYLGANLGGVFIVEGDSENNRIIKLVASYAFDRKKYHTKTIEIGEGLIGNCYLEKKPIYLKKIPEDYIEVGSGMGRTTPKALYISPLMIDQEVLGFIEIASIEDFEPHKIDFIKKLAENIAATFSTVKLNSKTAELLEESKRRSNEIAQQEEEMRQNLEEMQATQEELARLRSEDEQRTQSLKNEIDRLSGLNSQLINSMEGEVYLKDANGVIILANEQAAVRFNTTQERMAGKTDNDLFTLERAEKEHQLDMQVINEGIFTGELSELVGSQEVIYFIAKKRFFIPSLQENGIITIRSKR